MRPELTIIEQIERYLTKAMNAAERAQFEQQLKQDPALQKSMESQQMLMQAAKRASLRSTIQGAEKAHFLSKLIIKAGLIGAIVVTVVVGGFFIHNSTKDDQQSQNAEVKTEVIEEEILIETDQIIEPKDNSIGDEDVAIIVEAPIQALADPKKVKPSFDENKGGRTNAAAKSNTATNQVDLQENRIALDERINLDKEVFQVDAKKTTILHSKNNIVLAVPSNAFVDADGNIVEGDIDVEVQEALKPMDILKSGLSTISGDEVLETGGMFNIEASQHGLRLFLARDAKIIVDVPTDSVDPAMQHYYGHKNEDGIIDWVDPKPLDNFLTTIDMSELDLYPPNYVKTLKGMNDRFKVRTDKSYMDSLYYSFEYANENLDGPAVLAIQKKGKKSFVRNENGKYSISRDEMSKTSNGDNNQIYPGVRPSQVRTIWTGESFNNTILATREFEQRMKLIHRSCNPKMLDNYAKNLDKNMWELDLKAGELCDDPEVARSFKRFADRKDGRVAIESEQIQKLNEYYRQEQHAWRKIVLEAESEYWEEQARLDSIRQVRNLSQEEVTRKNDRSYYKTRVLAKWKKSKPGRDQSNLKNLERDRSNNYRVEVRRTGWHNIDAILSSIFPPSAKKQFPNTWELKLKLKLNKKYDQQLVYLIPSGTNSFVRLVPQANGAVTKRLKNKKIYHLVIAGIIGDSTEYFVKQNVQEEDKLNVTELDHPEQHIRKLFKPSQEPNILQDVSYREYAALDDQRQITIAQKLELRSRLYSVVFPCGIAEIEANSNSNESDIVDFVFNDVQQPAMPKDGLTMFTKKVQFYLANNYSKRLDKVKSKELVVVSFIVNKNGSLTDFQIVSEGRAELGIPVIETIQIYENWLPARHEGITVRQRVRFPIVFRSPG